MRNRSGKVRENIVQRPKNKGLAALLMLIILYACSRTAILSSSKRKTRKQIPLQLSPHPKKPLPLLLLNPPTNLTNPAPRISTTTTQHLTPMPMATTGTPKARHPTAVVGSGEAEDEEVHPYMHYTNNQLLAPRTLTEIPRMLSLSART